MTNADKLPTNDSNAIKKRKRGVGSGNLDYTVLDVDAQNLHRATLKDVQAIPSASPVFEKSSRQQAAYSPPTPSSLDHPSPWKANASTPGGHWYPNMSQSPGKPPEKLEIATPKDIEESFSDCIRSPIVNLTMNQNQLAKSPFSDKVGVSVQGSSLPISSWNGLPYDVNPSRNDNGLEQIRRETKQTRFDQQVSPLMGQSNQYVSCSRSYGSMERKARLQHPISDSRVASESLHQTRCDQLGISRGISQVSQILIDLTEPEEDDSRLGVGKTLRSPCNPIPKQVRRFGDSSDADPMSLKPGFKIGTPNLEQDSSIMQHETHISGVANQKNPISECTPASVSVLAGSFSMASALENYICLRKENNSQPKRTLSHYFPVIKPLVVDDRCKDDKTEISRAIKNVEPHTAILSMAKPQYIIPIGHRYFVVSTCFLGNRKLACRIQRLYPGAEFIERDHGPSASQFHHCANPASQLIDNTSDEADITISPGTGLILTTLQKIRQCSLPGQAVRLVVRERVAEVAPRYERLLILVGKDNILEYAANEGGNVAPFEVDSDYEVVTDFIGFCSSLKYNVQAMFIAGKEEQLAEWIVALMVKHAGDDTGVKLISEETTWELFLCRAGFNSFAAQAILGILPEQSAAAKGSTADNIGLVAFLKMSVEERVERFEEMFGGSELLKRVSSQLDARW